MYYNLVKDTMADNPETEPTTSKPYGWIGAIVVVAILCFTAGYFVHMPAATTSNPPPTTSSGNVTITFYESLAPSEASYFQNVIVPDFEAANPNITVAFANLPSGAVPSEIQTLESSNSVGSTIAGLDNLAVGQVIYSTNGNLLMNMTNIAPSMMPSSLIPSAVNMTNYEKNVFGGIYFLPFRSNIPLVFYNNTAFKAAGITTPPATNAQLLADAKLLNQTFPGQGTLPVMFQGAGTTGGHSGSSTGTELYQWMVQYGGNPFQFNSTADLHAWQFLYNLSAYFNPQYTGGYWGSYAGLAQGSYSLLDYQWPYVYNLLTNDTYKMNSSTLGVYGGPAGPANGNHLLGGDVLVIPKGSTHVWALEQMANYLLSAKAQKETLLNLSWVAVNKNAYTNLPSAYSAVGSALEKAISGGVFLRNPTPWITQWNVYASQAWADIIVSHTSYSNIPTVLAKYNQDMYNYLVSNYGQTVATNYENGGYGPISV